MPKHPRWLIDDTAGVTDARVFVAHLDSPRFVGELMPEDEADIAGVTLAAPHRQIVCRVHWFDPPAFDTEELLASLARAVLHHEAVRGGGR